MAVVVLLSAVLVGGVLHLRESCGILLTTLEVAIVVGQQTTLRLGIRHHALAELALVFGPVAIEKTAEVGFAKIACMVEHDIQDDLHAAFVGFVDECLETDVVRLVAMVHLGEVVGMVAMVVITRSVLYDGRDPYGGKTEGFDIVEFLDQSLEIASPSRVAGILGVVVPALGVVGRVTIVETGGDDEIDLLVAEVGSRREEGACRSGHGDQQGQKHKREVFFHDM